MAASARTADGLEAEIVGDGTQIEGSLAVERDGTQPSLAPQPALVDESRTV